MLLQLMLLVVVGIPAVVGDCQTNDVLIFITESTQVMQACDINGKDLAEDGACSGTACDITCTCRWDVVTCCKEQKCVDVEDDCNVLYNSNDKKLSCTTDDLDNLTVKPSEPMKSCILRLLSIARKRREASYEMNTTTEAGHDDPTDAPGQ